MAGKTIESLPDDIHTLLRDGLDPSAVDPDYWTSLGLRIADLVKTSLTDRSQEGTGKLRMSSIGQSCNRKLWYQVNTPLEAERLDGKARFKFLYGHILEELLLAFAELAGHRVEGRQDTLTIEGVDGHRDAVIDGTTTDSKSASSYAFKKFAEGRLAEDDAFGYIDQLQSYIHAGKEDPLVTDKDRGAFLVVDKTTGDICLDVHPKTTFPIEKVYQYKKELVSRPEPPERHFEDVPDGKSGNRKLGLQCGYCDNKWHCWPGLRGFAYSNGPRYLTVVEKEPDVPEFSKS